MALGGKGYWADGYWHLGYWHEDYWAESGATPASTLRRVVSWIFSRRFRFSGR